MPFGHPRKNKGADQQQKAVQRKNVDPIRQVSEDGYQNGAAKGMCVQRRKERFDFGKKKEGYGGKERYSYYVVLPNADGSFAHPAGILSSGRFTDDGEHADKAGKKEETFCGRKKTEALVQHVADRSAEMVQRHL